MPPFFFRACSWRGKWDPSSFFPLPFPRNKGRRFGAPPVYAMMFCFTVDTEWRKPTLHRPRPPNWWAEFKLSLKFTALGFCCSNRKLIIHTVCQQKVWRQKETEIYIGLSPAYLILVDQGHLFSEFQLLLNDSLQFPFTGFRNSFSLLYIFYSLRGGMVLTSSLYSDHI